VNDFYERGAPNALASCFCDYPVKIETLNLDPDVMSFEVQVHKLLKQDTAEGVVIVPVKMTEVYQDRQPGKRRKLITYTVGVKTVSINKDIPDERFTLPIESAKRFTDMTLDETP